MREQTNAKQKPRWERELEVDAVEIKTIEIRINEIKDATQRSRFVFVVLTIVASTVLIALWNGILSWDRDMAFPEKSSNSNGHVVEKNAGSDMSQGDESVSRASGLKGQVVKNSSDSDLSQKRQDIVRQPSADRVVINVTGNPPAEKNADDELIQRNQETVRQEWLKNLTISVGLLGIRISGTDLAVVGGFTFTVIMVWFFFSQRRENRAIVGLLRYCFRGYSNKQLGKNVCNLVYEGIVQSIVFIDMRGGDKPEIGLEPPATETPYSYRFVRTILTVLRFLPPIAIFLIVATDVSSLFMPSYLRDPNIKLWRVLFDGEHNSAVAKIFLFDSFGLLAGVYTYLLCLICREFSEATATTLNEFRQECCRE